MELRADLTESLHRLRPDRLRGELLVRAARMKDLPERPVAVDATAGFGEDSLLLAAAGYDVQLYELDPVIAALLRDALERAAAVPELAEAVGRMTLHEGDSIRALRELSEAPDLVYLDPMFPGRTKRALVKKKFQLLQQLERPCADEQELLSAAMAAGPRRIVIKRPLKGPYLAGVRPGFEIRGKTVRYDCIVPPAK
ncbi:MAG: class I SAM-dependent methyltransferase [Mogibacterium sp.]|nr:class I SAM-dependent methyltransferase [Mogibacterium sp.]